ncbi:hypothetical protein MLD38_030645 [Melastoma candidum]|uniref:Uncharacterized protein n=1 Tax=Melastoma candidum TaxID=119954 RepID=A0ACB9MLS6_9MYRT|nr:hypothetical protein MLD38_030645 [Melastoma candidum]
MASASLLRVSGGSDGSFRSRTEGDAAAATASTRGSCSGFVGTLDPGVPSRHKKRKSWMCCNDDEGHGIPLPFLEAPDYFVLPSLEELAVREIGDPGYLSRVESFSVGRYNCGVVRFLGKTDVRCLNLNDIVRFGLHEVVVYEDDEVKPPVGQGLNKAAEVTLFLRPGLYDLGRLDEVAMKLRQRTERQGATFISFDHQSGEWKFLAHHFSRFGLSEDDEEDTTMNDAPAVEETLAMDDGEVINVDEEEPQVMPFASELSHSLPAHLGLDPAKMNEMRMLMFPNEGDGITDFYQISSNQMSSFGKEYEKSPLSSSGQRRGYISGPAGLRKNPLPLIEYTPGNLATSPPGAIVLSQQNKGMPLKVVRPGGFELDIAHETPVTAHNSHNVVDAGLFMGRSFRVGWGPNGVLVHAGAPVSSKHPRKVLSSVINLERVAIDRAVRDEDDKVRKELVQLSFDVPLTLHKEISVVDREIEVGPFKLPLRKAVTDRLTLSGICRSYVDIVERELEITELPSHGRLILTHQVMVWELIKVLFADRESIGQSEFVDVDNQEDMMEDLADGSPMVDPEALPLIRRAEFSHWLQEYVRPRVQAEVSSMSESNYLEHLFLLLTGRQLDEAVELAAFQGDVRLGCLVSQAGGSPVNRSDISRQLELWQRNGLDFNFIEKDRIRILELLAGNIGGALRDINMDWKRFLGLLMWYQLPPDTSLSTIFQTYQHLLSKRMAPNPVPIYIDEGLVDKTDNRNMEGQLDLSYYLMLLHSNQDGYFRYLKTMFSAFSSTNDPLDHHMIWHQRALLEAVGVFSSKDLQVLDMGLVSQLLCLGQCHWAIYVVLHMAYCEDYPNLHATLIREILFQYCEKWSSEESQQQLIESLGVPTSWLHEALAVYHSYYGDVSKSLENYLKCSNWQKAHSIFVKSVAHKLFLSEKHSEIWRLATLMEEHKSEIENWDFGAGIFISFYSLKSSLKGEDDLNLMDSLESRNAASNDFLCQLKESLKVWSGLPLEARIAYMKMGEEISNSLLSEISDDPTRDVQLSCYQTACGAPIPEDVRSSHLQDAVLLFNHYLLELTS